MAHEIMNKKAMFYVGETPWHKLGTCLKNPPSTEEALKLAGLDWTVHKDAMYLETGRRTISSYKLDTGYYATWRYNADWEKVVLGCVSKRYEVVQNKEAFQPFDEVLLNHGYTYETAGALGNGERIWILAKAPNKRTVGDDKINQYVLLYNSHDGSSGIVMRPTLIRVVCRNTLDISLDGKGITCTLKHTKNVRERLDELTQALEYADGNITAAIETMKYMQEYTTTLKDVTKYFESLFPTLKKRGQTIINPQTGLKSPDYATPHYEALKHNYYHGQGNKGKTMWDAYNAVTEYIDHNKSYNDPLKSIGFNWGFVNKKKAFALASQMVNN